MNSIPFSTKISAESDSPMIATQGALKNFFRKVDRMLTAIAYAEAGNLDAVKEILDQDRAAKKK